MDEGALISAMTQKGHTQSTAEATITGRKKSGDLQNLWNEYMGAPTTTPASTGQSSGEFLKQQGEDFLAEAGGIQAAGVGAFTEGYGNLVSATTDLTNLEPLRLSAQNLTETLLAMPQQIQTAGEAAGMTTSQLQARMSAKLAEFAPSAQEAQRQYEYALGEFDRLLSLGMAPLEVAYSAVGESLRRLETVYSVEAENQLQINLEQLKQQGALDIETMKQTHELALAEQQYLSTEFKTIDGKLQLVNSDTGDIIRDYGVQGTGDTSQGYIKPKPDTAPSASSYSGVLQSLDQKYFSGGGNSIDFSSAYPTSNTYGAAGYIPR